MEVFARRFVAGLLVSLWIAFSAAPAGAASKGVVRIGLLDPSTGPSAPEGGEVDAGFRYFLASHGDQLGGFSVELRTGDEGATVDEALAVAHQLVEQDSVDAIVGVISSADAYGIAPYIDAQKKLLIITGAGADGLTQGAAQKTIFRVAHTSSQDVMPLGDYACHRMGRRTAAIVATDVPYGVEASGGFARAYTDAGCRIVQEQYLPGGTSDWSATVAKIDKRAQVVFGAVAVGDSDAFLTAYRTAGVRAKLLSDSTLVDERLLAQERERAIGVTSGLHYAATLATKTNESFRLGYEALTGHAASQFVENGYVAAQMLSLALAKLGPGTLKVDALLGALRAVSLDAPRGPVHFDRFQQVVDNVYVRRTRQVGGRFRNDVIDSYANVSQFWQYQPEHYLQLPTYDQLKGSWAKP